VVVACCCCFEKKMKIPLIKTFSPYGAKTLLHRRPAMLPPLVWGAITSVLVPVFRRPLCAPSIKAGMSWIFLTVLLASFMNNTYIGPVILGYALFIFGLYFYEKRYMTRKLQTAIDTDLQSLLEPWGYRTNNCFENTGECYIQEYALEIIEPTVKLSPQELLARAPQPPLPQISASTTTSSNDDSFAMVAEPIVVYLHGTPFQHTVTWWCNTKSKRPPFVTDPCPLPNVPWCVWGALQNDVWCERLEESQQTFVAYVELWVLIMVLALCAAGNGVFWVIFLSPGLLVILAVGNSLLTTTSRNVAHVQWEQSIHEWQDIFAQFGWQIEYHHAPLEASCLSSPDFWLRFVPLSV
jgi:hypothetical protein